MAPVDAVDGTHRLFDAAPVDVPNDTGAPLSDHPEQDVAPEPLEGDMLQIVVPDAPREVPVSAIVLPESKVVGVVGFAWKVLNHCL